MRLRVFFDMKITSGNQQIINRFT